MHNGIRTNCWGNPTWVALHSIAYAYSPTSDQVKKTYYDFFMGLGKVLPCMECRDHYKENVKEIELFNALDSQETFFRWLYDLHNLVNKQTGVPEKTWPSYEAVKTRYNNYKSDCNEIPGACGSKDPHKIRTNVVEQFSNGSYDNTEYIIPIAVLLILLIISLSINIKYFLKK